MITKNQKMLLGVGAVAVVGYLVYQQMNKKSFAGEKMNASGRVFAKTRASSTCGPGDVCDGPAGNVCGESCLNGFCNIAKRGPHGEFLEWFSVPCSITK
jgi:hypothetical protein